MLAPTFYRNRKVCVLGLGRSGCASALALQEVGAEVLGWDDNADRRDQAVQQGVVVANDVDAALEGDVLLPAPGIPLTHPQPHPMVASAKNKGMEILGDVELFQQTLNEQAAADWIAITGTNGKSTTASLVAHMLRKADFEVALGGNIGVPAMTLPAPSSDLVYVLEVSSFQIELSRSLAPDIAVQLNIAPDHLDRHGSLQEYADIKAKLFDHLAHGKKQGVAIVGIDDVHGRALFSRLSEQKNLRLVALALEEADLPPALESVRVQNGELLDNMRESQHQRHDLSAIDSLIGTHNHQNMAAAYAIGRIYGLSGESILESFADFSPPPHRMERVADINGVAFINDSKATNADAAARSLACFDDIHWILGGIPKADGIESLRGFFAKISHAYLIGTAKEQFASVLQEGGVSHNSYDNLHDAVDAAAKNAQAGSVVLLAPACSSFDQFADFEARGDAFRTLVQERVKLSGAAS